MKIIYQGGEAEIIEKKSRFIATVQPVKNEKEALEFVSSVKKRYWDATHNCSAFVTGERQELQHCSDDGEPQGTAGRPMLEVLLGEEIHYTAVVVTRYFGGTLLGTGGLVRAYSKAVQEGLKASVIASLTDGIRLTVRTDYNSIGKLQYLLGTKGIPILDTVYTDMVQIFMLIPAGEEKNLREAIDDVTAGRAEFEKEEPVSYALVDGKPIIFN